MKKILSLILVVLMVLVCMPVKETFADDSGNDGKIILWENDGSIGVAAWGNTYRFSNVEAYNPNEVVYAFPDDAWEWIKNSTFYVDVENQSEYVMRVTTGHWNVQWTGADISFSDTTYFTDTGDGTNYVLKINFEGDPIVDELDEKHLNFVGGNYIIHRIYLMDYQISSGDNITVNVSKGDTASFVSVVSLANFFKGVAVNGNVLEESNYEKDESTNTITLKADYLYSLPNGNYTFSIIFDDGRADANFTVTGHPKPAPAPVHEILNTGVN